MDEPTRRPGTFVASLDAQGVTALLSLGTVRRYRRGATLFWEGDSSDQVAVVLAGTVKIEAGSHGVASVLALRGPGDLLGELAALDGYPRSASAVALEPVTVRMIPGADFERFLTTHPGAATTLLRQVVLKLRDADRSRIEFGNLGVPGRLARRIVELSQLHGRADGDGTLIDVPLTQQDLAAMIGASREAVARALRTMRAQGLVTTRRRALVVLDLDALKRRSVG